MNDTGFNPLTQDTLVTINAGCEECARAMPFLENLQKLGHPVKEHIAKVQAANEYLTNVKKLFFPGAQ